MQQIAKIPLSGLGGYNMMDGGIHNIPITFFKQEAHRPRVAHLSDIATADMQMLCNIFPILSSQLMKDHHLSSS